MARHNAQDPVLKRSIRTIQSELEFLADSDLLSQEQLSSILAQLPSASTLQPAQTTHHAPLTDTFNDLNISPSPAPAPAQPDYYASTHQSEKQNQASNNYSTLQPPPSYPVAPQPPVQQQPTTLTHATALYAYQATDAYDLQLQAGDSIAVTEFMNSEWWKGRSERTGAEGIFPRNYVRADDMMPPNVTKMSAEFGNGPQDVAYGGAGPSDPGRVQTPSKTQEYGKKFGKKMGNAAIFGAGATIGSNIVNGIF